MSTSSTSVLKQSNNAGGDASEKRRGSGNEKSRLAFVEVLRGVYMKNKGQPMHWSDVKKGYKRKTGQRLTAVELNALCGTTNLPKHEIINTKFAPLLTFVDDKFEIVSICPNDCGGTGIHNENEIYCESCVTSGKMPTSEIKVSGSSYSSYEENQTPGSRICSAVSEVSSNFYPNSTMHTAARLGSVDDETNNDGVFQESVDAEESLTSPVQSPTEAEKTIRSEYAFSVNESDASVPLLDLMESFEPWKSDTTQQNSEDDVETTVVQESTLNKQESSSDDSKSSEEALELNVDQQLPDGYSDAETIPADELYGANRESNEVLELDTTQQDSEDDLEAEVVEKNEPVAEEQELPNNISNPSDVLELDITQQDSEVETETDLETEVDEPKEPMAEKQESSEKTDDVLELATTQQDPEDDVNTEAILDIEVVKKSEPVVEKLETTPRRQHVKFIEPTDTLKSSDASESEITQQDLDVDTKSETDLDTEVDEKKDLVVEKREVANEVMHRRRKAKCCSVM